MRAEGLNLSPLFQIIFCLEVSSEISHYLSFRVSAHHEICCPPAWPALGLTSKLSHSDSHSSWLQNHPAQDLGSQWDPSPCSLLSLCLSPHGGVSLLTWTCSHTTAHLCQTRQLFQSSQRQTAFEKGDISFFIPAQAPHSCYMIMSLSGGKSQNINFNLWL